MSILNAIDPLYSVSGFAVGLLVGLTGVGGGSLMTPLLVLLFGIQPHTAVGTDLLYASLTKACGTMVHGHNRTIDWVVVRRLAAGSVPATVATLFLIHRFEPFSNSATLISTVLGLALMLTAVSVLLRRQIIAFAATHVGEIGPSLTRIVTIIVGAILGALVSISSVGAGALGVTVLVFLYPRLPLARLVGSDIAHAVPLTAIAGIGHWWLGDVNGLLLGSLLIGSLPGIFIGSHLTARVPEGVLRPALALVLVVVGSRLVMHPPEERPHPAIERNGSSSVVDRRAGEGIAVVPVGEHDAMTGGDARPAHARP
jgi:hypothetical protein